MEFNSSDDGPHGTATMNSSCFFCLQDSRKYIKSELVCDLSSQTEFFSLRHITRFLKIFESLGNTANISKDLNRKLFKFANDTALPVCLECSKLTKEFMEYYNVLEETKLRLNWCVQRMHHVMTNVKDIDVKADTENLIGHLRIKTMEQMALVTAPMPKVILTRLPKRHFDRPKTMLSSSSSKNDYTPPDEKFDLQLQVKSLVSLLVTKPKSTPDIYNPEATVERSTIATTTTPSAQVDDKCSYCRYEPQEKSSFSGAWMLRQHTLQYHCEHYFPNEKLDNVTDAQYKKILAELLFKDSITGNGCCSFCSKTFPGRKGQVNISRMKSHLVESHHTELKENLMHIQKDPNLLDTLSKSNPQGMVCDCGVYLPDMDSQTIHKTLHCNLLTSKSLKKKMMVRTRERISFESNFIPSASNKEIVTCKSCNKIMKRNATLWHYTYTCHKGLLRCPPGKNFTALVNQGTPFSCNYCRKEFAGPKRANLLIHHWIRFHPEQFFLDEMNNLDLDGVTKLQFQMILHNILFPDLEPKLKDYKSCILCKEKFNFFCGVRRKYLLRKHLLYLHKPHLNERLAIILKDQKLHERLDLFSMKGKGIPCPCGMYLASLNTSRRNHHEKYHCTLKNSCRLSPEDQRLDEFTLDTDDEDEDEDKTPETKRYPDFFDDVLNSVSDCPFCRAQLQGKFDFRCHVILYHCKHLFPNHKLDAITDPQFQKILVELLFKFNDQDKGCVYCKNGSWKKGQDQYKVHLVRKHYEELEKRLKEIQEDPEVLQRLARVNPEGGMCRCGIYLQNRNIGFIEMHDKYQCTITPRSSLDAKEIQKGDDAENERRDSIRNASFSAPKAKRASVFTVHVYQKPSKMKRLGLGCDMTSPSPCKVPVTATSMKEESTGYQTTEAKDDVKPEVDVEMITIDDEDDVDLLGNGNPNLQAYRMQMHTKLQSNKRLIPPPNKPKKESSLSCDYCRMKFRSLNVTKRKYLLTNHLVRFHPEHFFLDKMKMKTVTVTMDQFQRIINHILLPEFFPDTNKSIEVCPLCPKKFNMYTTAVVRVDCYLKRHLVEDHREKLAERLGEIIEEPDLIKSLSEFERMGMSCSCGMYIPEWREFNREYHYKFHCNLAPPEEKVDLDAKDEFLMDSDDKNGFVESSESVNKNASDVNENATAQNGPQKCLKCSYCLARFSSGATSQINLLQHMMQYHLEHYFPKSECKLDFISHLQFQKILVELLFQDHISPYRDSCLYCKKEFSLPETTKKNDLKWKIHKIKSHLVRFHTEKLKLKLEGIQKDPNLPEKLANVNPNGRVCQFCGIYLTSMEVQRTHEKLHCNGKRRNLNNQSYELESPEAAAVESDLPLGESGESKECFVDDKDFKGVAIDCGNGD